MTALAKKVFLFFSLILFFSQRIDKVFGQGSSHDSIDYFLNHIAENTKDQAILRAVGEARNEYSRQVRTSTAIDVLVAKTLLNVDSILVTSSKFDRPTALSFATALARLLEQSPLRSQGYDYATSLNILALLYFSISQYDKSISLYEKALVLRNTASGKENEEFTTILVNLANIYVYTGRYNNALPLYQQALATRKRTLGEGHPEYATILNRLAFFYFQTGQYDTALSLFKQALTIRKRTSGEGHPDFANSLNNFGLLYFVTGQYDKALTLFEEALVISKKRSGDDSFEYATILNRMGLLYFSMAQFDKALPLYWQALAIRKKTSGEDHAEYATILNNLGLLYFGTGQYDKALPLYEKGLEIRKKTLGEYNPLYADNLNNLANLYFQIGQFDEAIPLFEKALAIRKQILGKMHPDYAENLDNLADLYLMTGNYNKVLPLYKEALDISKKTLGENHHGYANNLISLGQFYVANGQFDKAAPLFEQALAIKKKIFGEKHPVYAGCIRNLASLYFQTGEYDKALPLFQQALKIEKETLGEDHPDYISSLKNLANLYAETGKFTEATALLVRQCKSVINNLKQTYNSLSEEEKMKLLKIKSSDFDLLPSLLYRLNYQQPPLLTQVYTNELALKGMVLEDQKVVMNNIRKMGDSTALRLYQQWRFDKAFLGKQLLLPKAKRISYFDSLQEVSNQLEQELSSLATSFRNLKQSQSITAKDISQKLKKGQAAVEFISFRLYHKKWSDSTMYAALVLLPSDTTPQFIPLFEEKQLQTLLKFSARQLSSVAAINTLYDSDSLYNLIWKPIENCLSGVNTVYYAPAGLLHRISFQALRSDSSHLLVDQYRLNQVLSTRSVALPVQPFKKPASVAIWANIEYGVETEAIAGAPMLASRGEINTADTSFNFYNWDTRGARNKEWKSLPGTKTEMDSIENQLHAAGLVPDLNYGTMATEEAFKALDGKSPGVLHLATHAFFLPVQQTKPADNSIAGSNVFTVQQNPMFRSGLILAGANYTWKGGRALYAKEDGILTAYEIAQMDLSNTELVVLSACETALGELQGNEGAIGLQRAFKLAGVKQLIVSLWRVPDKETAELMTMFYHNWMAGQTEREALRSAQLKMRQKYSPYYWAGFVAIE